MNIKTLSSISILALTLTGTAVAATDPMVGGAAMYANKNIIQNAMHSQDHTTLVKAVKAAGLVRTLEGPGPYTVFAPDQSGVRSPAVRHGPQPAEAAEQAGIAQGPDLSRGAGYCLL